MNKKIILISLFAAAVLLLTACLGPDTPTAAPATQDPSYPPPSGGQQSDPSYPPPSGNLQNVPAYPAPEEGQVSKVSEVLGNPDGFSSVTIRGEIIEQIEGEKYLFRDASSTIQLEIDSSISWDGTLNQTVLILGDVETNDGVIQVEVRSVTAVK